MLGGGCECVVAGVGDIKVIRSCVCVGVCGGGGGGRGERGEGGGGWKKNEWGGWGGGVWVGCGSWEDNTPKNLSPDRTQSAVVG